MSQDFTYRISPDEVPSETVIDAVANAKNVDPTELSPPLYHAIDHDALDALFSSSGESLQITFEYSGFEITIGGSGSVTLSPID